MTMAVRYFYMKLNYTFLLHVGFSLLVDLFIRISCVRNMYAVVASLTGRGRHSLYTMITSTANFQRHDLINMQFIYTEISRL